MKPLTDRIKATVVNRIAEKAGAERVLRKLTMAVSSSRIFLSFLL
jgi:hypothetical protein